MAILGIFIPIRSDKINLQQVVDVDTICSVLCKKGKLTEEDYQFEHQIVAPYYDNLTFLGYLFFMKPFIFNLKRNDHFDSLFQYLIFRWIRVHKSFDDEHAPRLYSHNVIAKISTQIAFYIGRVLIFSSNK